MRDRLDLGYILKASFSENLNPISRDICFVSPGLNFASREENISKHADPGVAFFGILPKLLNILNWILILNFYQKTKLQ